MAREESAEVPRGHPEAVGKPSFRAVVERAVEDHLNAAADELRPAPEDEVGHSVGPATQACSETRRLGGGGEPEPHDVLLVGARATPGPAVDPGGHDRREGLHRARYSGPRVAASVAFGHATGPTG